VHGGSEGWRVELEVGQVKVMGLGGGVVNWWRRKPPSVLVIKLSSSHILSTYLICEKNILLYSQ